MLQVIIGKFYRQIKKNKMMASSWRHFMFLGFENFVKQDIGCHVNKFEICWLSGSTFMAVSLRLPKTPLWRHYDVISDHCVSELAYFIEHEIGYHPSKFQWSRMSG